MKITNEYKVGDRVWWWNAHVFVRCTVTRVDDQWRKKDKDGTLFYEIDEPTGHSLGADELSLTLEEAVGDASQWEEGIGQTPLGTLEEIRKKRVRFILSTHLEGAYYAKPGNVPDAEVEKALLEWKYPPKKQGEDWLTFEDAVEKVRR